MRRRGRALVAVSVALAAVGLTACGGDDFDNEPRPPIALEISVQVSDDDLTVSPAEFGAGIANFTVVNFGQSATSVKVDGSTIGRTPAIAPGSSAVLKMEMEPGDYEAVALGVDEPFAFEVGPERESASNDLLLP